MHGPIFENRFALSSGGQKEFTGLTLDGENQYKAYLLQVNEARADPVKVQFEKDHLAHCRGLWNIQLGNWEADERRRNRGTVQAGLAEESKEEAEFDDSGMFPADEDIP